MGGISLVRIWIFNKCKIMKVLIGGAFDLLHTGHIFRIKLAKAMGSYLVVNVTPDERVKRKKGEERPILSVEERLVIVNNIKEVDEVTSINEKGIQEVDEYEMECIKKIKPDVFVTKQHTESLERYCIKNNVRLIILEDTKGIDKMHTTDIINRIKE